MQHFREEDTWTLCPACGAPGPHDVKYKRYPTECAGSTWLRVSCCRCDFTIANRMPLNIKEVPRG